MIRQGLEVRTFPRPKAFGQHLWNDAGFETWAKRVRSRVRHGC